MDKKREILICFGAILSSLFFMLAVILGIILHIWTVIIAYKYSGIVPAALSLPFPVFAQIFWFVRIWIYEKTFFNPFCLLVTGYVIFWIIIRGLSFMSETLEAVDMKKSLN